MAVATLKQFSSFRTSLNGATEAARVESAKLKGSSDTWQFQSTPRNSAHAGWQRCHKAPQTSTIQTHPYNALSAHKFITDFVKKICLKKHLQETACTRDEVTAIGCGSTDLDEAQEKIKCAGCSTKHAEPDPLVKRKKVRRTKCMARGSHLLIKRSPLYS